MATGQERAPNGYRAGGPSKSTAGTQFPSETVYHIRCAGYHEPRAIFRLTCSKSLVEWSTAKTAPTIFLKFGMEIERMRYSGGSRKEFSAAHLLRILIDDRSSKRPKSAFFRHFCSNKKISAYQNSF